MVFIISGYGFVSKLKKSILKESIKYIMVERKQECGLVVLGHSNTGKSTLCGQILLSLNKVD